MPISSSPGGVADEPSAVQQRRPHLKHRHVELHGAHVQRALAGTGHQLACVVEQAEQVAVLDRHRLGPPGRARGEHRREQAVGAPVGREWRRRLTVEAAEGRVERNHARVAGVEPVDQVVGDDPDPAAGGVQQLARADDGGVGVERRVGGAGLDGRKHRDDRAGAALRRHGDDVSSAYAGCRQAPGQTVAVLVELAVAERHVVGDQRDLV
ncbi:MAG TPA: hypothetical protein VFW38_09190 [Solirubrobacteraceae bacterium]|nr:hypothetical protein [Solirubrobacteraceae bacterium]